MKHTVVYVPVKVEDELPEDKTECYFTITNGMPNVIGSHLWNFNGVDGWDNEDDTYAPPDIWLKPTENTHLFTEEELLEQKRKWMEEAWEAGEKYSESKRQWQYGGILSDNKQTFLNSIKLD